MIAHTTCADGTTKDINPSNMLLFCLTNRTFEFEGKVVVLREITIRPRIKFSTIHTMRIGVL